MQEMKHRCSRVGRIQGMTSVSSGEDNLRFHIDISINARTNRFTSSIPCRIDPFIRWIFPLRIPSAWALSGSKDAISGTNSVMLGNLERLRNLGGLGTFEG
jgi:hypothetical protein